MGRLSGCAVSTILLATMTVGMGGQVRAESPIAQTIQTAGMTDPGAGSQTAQLPNVNCTCRFSGRDYHIGDTACIRGEIATCTTFLNNTSWTMSKSPCPMADYSPIRRSQAGG